MSKLIETQVEYQRLAVARLEEAEVLLAAGKWGGAYYLAGYALELGLKSCVIKRLMATDAFPEKEFSKDCYTHSLERLLKLAGLEAAFDAAKKADPALGGHWKPAKDWSEQKRYHLIEEAEARNLLLGIGDPAHGVLSWVKTCW